MYLSNINLFQKIASDIISGKYKNIMDVENDSRYSNNKDVIILRKTVKDPSNDQITIIETFFEKE